MSSTVAVLAIDQGTTGSRALLVGRDGGILGSAYEEFPQYFPGPGLVEHDPEEIWGSVLSTVERALAAADLTPGQLVGLGITNQRETTVVWERETGRPMGPAIVWQDRRTTDRCAALSGTPAGTLIRDRTGLVVDPYFSATKLEWLLERNPAWRDRAASGELLFGTVDSWVLFRLTGGGTHATDHTNASRTLLYSLDDGDWDPELCAIFGVPEGMLPEVRDSAGHFGTTDPDVLGAEIPVAGVAGDQQAALYGHGGWSRGDAKNTYGTGAFLLLHTGGARGPPVPGVLTTVACGPRGERAFAYEGAVLIAGAAIQWLRDGIQILDAAPLSEEQARSVSSTEGAYFVPALVGLGTPHWAAGARGTMVGLSRGTRRAHIVRAALEAIAYSVDDALEAMLGPSDISLGTFRADGGAARNDWLMQFQADLLQTPVHRPAAAELTAIGAAGLAGVATGFWSEPEGFLPAHGAERVFEPDALRMADMAGWRAGWKRAVRTALFWASERSRSP
jgi:glycerol kinase